MRTIRLILKSFSIFIFYTAFLYLISNNHEWILFSTLSFTSLIGIKFYNNEKNKNLRSFILFILPTSIIFTLICFFQKGSIIRALPYILFIPLISFITLKSISINKYKFFFGILVMNACIAFILFPNWFSFYANYESRVDIKMPLISLHTSTGEKIHLNNDTVYVLDFWTTTCGVCFQKFPAFEDKYFEYINNEKIELFTVNVPLEIDDSKKTLDLVNRLSYEFPTLYTKSSNKEIENILNYNGYPMMLIVKNNRIYYKGQFIDDKRVFIHSLDSEIKRVLNI